MKNNNCPCVDCICVAVCRNKSWRRVLEHCSSIRQYLFSSYKDKDTKVYIEMKDIKKGYTVSEFQDEIMAIGHSK